VGYTIDLLEVAIGGFALYIGAEWLVKGSAGLARAFGVKPLVIGLTVIAYGTSAPELAVSMAAALDGSNAIVLGNVLGSCVANLCLILGITALISPPTVDGSLIKREIPVLIVSALAVPVCLWDGLLSPLEAGILLAASVGFTVVTLTSSSKSDNVPSAEEMEDHAEAAGAPPGGGKVRLGLITVVGLALLLGAGQLFVHGAQNLALKLGMSERLVGLTIVAIGTSLPELAASVVAAMRGYAGLAVGNVVGSNIFNIFLVLGAVGLVRPIDGDLSLLRLDVGFVVGATLVGALMMRGSRRITRTEGALLLVAYGSFIVLAAIGW
jgi:cation:H+ antiporter